jgi:O-antigen/teichoic acid export membrane protein
MEIIGVEEFGIYTVVAGVVSMLSFVTSALVRTTQRYMSYYQGKSDINYLSFLFNNCLALHIVLGVVISIILCLMTPLLFNGFLNIPEVRVNAAILVFFTVIGMLFFTLISSPYKALLISHENIVYISIIEVIDGLLKVILVIGLKYISYDKLIIYGALMFGVQVFNFLAFSIYCFSHYNECRRLRIKEVDFAIIKEITGYTGWNIYNTGCIVGRNQGVSIILNRLLGATINAAYGIAFQVAGCVGVLSNSIKNAFSPQIMRSEGSGDRARMIKMAEIETKISLLLLCAISIPIIFEIDGILILWLKEVPDYCSIFCIMMLLACIADTMTTGLCSINLAIGNLKNFSIYSYTLKIVTVPIAALCKDPYQIAVVFIVFETASSLIRLPLSKKESGINASSFVYNVLIKLLLPIISTSLVSYFLSCYIHLKYGFLINISISFLFFICVFIVASLNLEEKEVFARILESLRNKFIKQ